MRLLGILLQAGEGGQTQWSSIIMMVGIVGVFYFFMIRPQQKKSKDAKRFREDIKKGDLIVTIGGIYGKILGFEGETILLEVDKGTRLKIEKGSVSAEATAKLNKDLEEKK